MTSSTDARDAPDAEARAARRAVRDAALPLAIIFAVLLVAVVIIARSASTAAAVIATVVAVLLCAGASVAIIRYALRPLEDALRMQHAVVSETSRELRAPLVVLDARLQFLQRRLDPADAIAPEIDELRRDVQALLAVMAGALGDESD